MSQVSDLKEIVYRKGGIDENRYAEADVYESMWLMARMINAEVMKVMKDSDYQGERSTHDLNAPAGVPQREYLNPIDLIKIKKVDVKLDGTNWRTCKFFDVSDVRDKLAAEADIIQRFNNEQPYIDLFDESYFIYSGTFGAVSGGITIWYNKDIVGVDGSGDDIQEFTNDTDVPNLIEFAQQALVMQAIIDWYSEHFNENKLSYWNKQLWGFATGRPPKDNDIGGLMRTILDHYGDKAPDRQMSMRSEYQQETFE